MLINQLAYAYLDDFDFIFITSNEKIKSICIESNGHLVALFDGNNGYEQEISLDQKLLLNVEYTVIINNVFHVPLVKRGVVLTKEFDELFYTVAKLGSYIENDTTIFKLWAPVASSVMLRASYKKNVYVEDMIYKNGVYEVVVDSNLELYEYSYIIKVNGETKEVIDPYAISSTCNGNKSVVIDVNKFIFDCDFIKQKSYSPVIYETSICDFTSHVNAPFKNKGKYLGFCEKGLLSSSGNKIGIEHVVDMGYDYLQLMPIYDFGSVNELIVADENYNWGYDPVQYFTFEGSFLVNKDPISRITEPQSMIKSMKENNMGVIMDVVFNHVYDKDTFSLGVITPYYPYRMTTDYEFLNGSLCGNELATERKMMSKFITDAVLFYSSFYKIDGFRFDLMGLMDVNLINHIHDEVSKINPNTIIYGEGWNMDCGLDQTLRATQINASQMPNVGFFDDDFRDYIKGDNADFNRLGVVNRFDYKEVDEKDFLSIDKTYVSNSQKVRYVSCHDDHTLYDYLRHNTLDELKLTEQIMYCYNYIFQLSGIKFIHSGCEFKRSKNGVKNTYNSLASINAIDWNNVDKNISIIENLKQLIRINQGVK